MDNYYKYLKYKNKYLNLKKEYEMIGGLTPAELQAARSRLGRARPPRTPPPVPRRTHPPVPQRTGPPPPPQRSHPPVPQRTGPRRTPPPVPPRNSCVRCLQIDTRHEAECIINKLDVENNRKKIVKEQIKCKDYKRPNVYLLDGHGCTFDNTFKIYDDCILINNTVCGVYSYRRAVDRIENNETPPAKLEQMFKNLDKRLYDPVYYKKEIEDKIVTKINIHTSTFNKHINELKVSIWGTPGSYFGLIKMPTSGIIDDTVFNISAKYNEFYYNGGKLSPDDLKILYAHNVIYPTEKDISRLRIKRILNPSNEYTKEELNKILSDNYHNRSGNQPQLYDKNNPYYFLSEIMNKYPGIYYPLSCRTSCDATEILISKMFKLGDDLFNSIYVYSVETNGNQEKDKISFDDIIKYLSENQENKDVIKLLEFPNFKNCFKTDKYKKVKSPFCYNLMISAIESGYVYRHRKDFSVDKTLATPIMMINKEKRKKNPNLKLIRRMKILKLKFVINYLSNVERFPKDNWLRLFRHNLEDFMYKDKKAKSDRFEAGFDHLNPKRQLSYIDNPKEGFKNMIVNLIYNYGFNKHYDKELIEKELYTPVIVYNDDGDEIELDIFENEEDILFLFDIAESVVDLNIKNMMESKFPSSDTRYTELVYNNLNIFQLLNEISKILDLFLSPNENEDEIDLYIMNNIPSGTDIDEYIIILYMKKQEWLSKYVNKKY